MCNIHIIAQNAPQTGIHTFKESSVLSRGKWVKISVPNTGIYQITYSELEKMGFSSPSKVSLYGIGGEILNEKFNVNHYDDLSRTPFINDKNNSRLVIFARGIVKWTKDANGVFTHKNNNYSKQGFYFLHQEEDDVAAIDTLSSDTFSDDAPYYFSDHLLYELDEVSLGHNGRELYGESFLYTQTRNFKFEIPSVVSQNVLLTVDFAAKSLSQSAISISINKENVLKGTIDAVSDEKFDYGVAWNKQINWINNENVQTLDVGITYTPNSSISANLNYIRLNFLRELTMYNKDYVLFNGGNSFIINGNIDNCVVWKLPTENNNQSSLIYPIKNNSGKNGFAVSHLNADNNEYALLNINSAFPSVNVVGSVENQNLHSLSQFDLIIVTSSELMAEAERLARFRTENDNLRVVVVDKEKIYNEFSSGTPDATAIRLFMKMFYDRGVILNDMPSWLLLFGDGAFDNRAMNSSLWSESVMKNMILTYQTDYSLNETVSYVCDDYFGFLDDNEGGVTDKSGNIVLNYDKLDLGIGRIPVRTLSQAKIVVDKIIAYSSNSKMGAWKNKLCFVGDDDDANIHMFHAQSMIDKIIEDGHKEYVFNKIYLDAYKLEKATTGNSYPDARKKFLELISSGEFLVNYSGHGSKTNLTSENLFTINDAKTIVSDYPAIWVTATCDFSRYDDVDTSAGEELLLNEKGGAIALFTTSRVVYTDGNLFINRELVSHLFDRDENGNPYRLGDVMKKSKLALGNNENKMNFVLLGDPSMTMAYPKQKIKITHINGVEVGETPIQIKALSTVDIKGEILNVEESDVDADFSGDLNTVVYDSEENFKTLDNLNSGNPFEYTDRTKILYSGSNKIVDGRFEFSFIVPKDINYSMKSGMINMYALSSTNNEANGYFDGFIIGGTSDDVSGDTISPTINYMYLNSQSFLDGQTVNSTPYFVAQVEDNSGINTTGTAIGHDLCIVITGMGQNLRYVLNDYFYTQDGSQAKGDVRFSIPELNDGSYSLEFKVWDIFNNSSTKSLNFVVNKKQNPELFELSTEQNPVVESAKFLIYHNRPETNLSVCVEVFTQMGQKVWESSINSSSSFNEPIVLQWNLNTGSGQKIIPGIYIYRASIASPNSSRIYKSKKLIVM